MSILAVALVVLSGTFVPALGQASSTAAIPTPAEESFVEATDFLIPWLNSDCPTQNGDKIPVPNCAPEIALEGYSYHRLQLYNSDGSLWYAFSIVPRENDAFIARGDSGGVMKRTDFVPLKTDSWNHEDAPATLVLRLRAESPDWYEVEVNENTRETKFAPRKAYRMWTKVPGSFWLYKSVHLKIGGKEMKLLDTPNGKIIAGASELNFDWVRFVRSEGDWALVEEDIGGHKYSGWIRWRNGREILVGGLMNKKQPNNLNER